MQTGDGINIALITLAQDNHEPIVDAEGIVLVDCWAATCSACRTFQPVFEKIAAGYPEHTPTLFLYRDGILLFRQQDSFDEEKLDIIVRQAESLSMSEVRKQLKIEKDREK